MIELNSDPQKASSMPVCVTRSQCGSYLNLFQFGSRESLECEGQPTDHVMLTMKQLQALKQYLANNDL